MDLVSRQKDRLLVLALGLHAFALTVTNLRWSAGAAPFQKLVEPYLIPTAQQQPFRALALPSRLGFKIKLTPLRADGSALPPVRGEDLPFRERAFLADAARREGSDRALSAAIVAVLPRLGGERPAAVVVDLARSTAPGGAFEPLPARTVAVPP